MRRGRQVAGSIHRRRFFHDQLGTSVQEFGPGYRRAAEVAPRRDDAMLSGT
ncbi:MAG: hypothetical protein AB8I08_21290 [Sandaracinaceae bacterium]